MRSLLVLFILILSYNVEGQVYRCGAMTTKNVACKIRVKEQGLKCHHHAKDGTGTGTGTLYYCGAITTKGKPCKRRVKTQGTKCYSHE